MVVSTRIAAALGMLGGAGAPDTCSPAVEARRRAQKQIGAKGLSLMISFVFSVRFLLVRWFVCPGLSILGFGFRVRGLREFR